MIDLFVESLSIKDYGFRTDFPENGRPAYHPSDLLKLFIYGYMNKVRYSRDLEKECSTKLRAQNSKKNNYNQAKINRHIAYIDNKLEEYTRALAENDGDNRQQIEDEIGKQQKRKDNYRSLEQQLKESGEPQISVSDPESRQIMIRNNITEVAYNVQSTVDSKNCIPIDYKVTNQNDSKAMGNGAPL